MLICHKTQTNKQTNKRSKLKLGFYVKLIISKKTGTMISASFISSWERIRFNAISLPGKRPQLIQLI